MGRPVSIGIFFMSDSIQSGMDALINGNGGGVNGVDGVEITCVDKGFDRAVAEGRRLENQGVEVLIARRGTAHMLRKQLSIPVLAFPTSTVGLLTSIKEAASLGGKIILPVYEKPIGNFDFVRAFFPVDIEQAVYWDEASLFSVVGDAAQRGFAVAVGGKGTQRAALAHGLRHCDLVTLENEIVETIESAKSVAMSARAKRARLVEYQTIMDVATEAIIATDKGGRISSINRGARTLLGLGDEDPLGRPLVSVMDCPAVLSALNKGLGQGEDRGLDWGVERGQRVMDQVIRFKDILHVLNITPIRVDAVQLGAVVSIKPGQRVVQAENRVRQSLAKGFVARYTFEDIRYQSPVMDNWVTQAREFAKTRSSVLIMGETGTGKELFAQSIHNASDRRGKPFVSVNCGALPTSLLESELFGYEEGAFTGSKKGGKAGLFELAHGGSLFLDEIDSTPIMVQKRLLRVLQEKEVMRLGGGGKIPVDVRIIVASGSELWPRVERKKFRKDLFFRLNILQIRVPALRERPSDIPLLLDYFSGYYQREHTIDRVPLTPGQLQRILDYSWPGNVRQFKAFVERLVLQQLFGNLGIESLTNALIDELYRIGPSMDADEKMAETCPAQALPPEALTIVKALENSQYNRGRTAESLGISRATLWRRMKKYELVG